MDGSTAVVISDYLKGVVTPAVAREVSDVTGAGNTVVATFAVGLAAGGAALDAARIANHAAGIVVGKFGPSVVAQAELLASLSHQE